jgi:hypothetical protein
MMMVTQMVLLYVRLTNGHRILSSTQVVELEGTNTSTVNNMDKFYNSFY